MAVEFKKKSEEAAGKPSKATKPGKAPKAAATTQEQDDDTPPFPLEDGPATDTPDAKPAKQTKAKKTAKGSPELNSALETLSKVEKEQPKATIITQHGTGVETTETEDVGPPVLKTKPMANVGLTVGATVNLGDYNNAKFSVSLFMPSELDDESLDATFERINEWVEAKAAKLHAELQGEEG